MTTFWTDLHNAICYTLKAEIQAIQTCEVYPSIRKELLAPAVFVELSSLESGKDPGTEELALKARFEARIIIDSTIENAPLIVRSLAAEVARVVNKNTFNMNISPGEFTSAEIDGFRPELDAYLIVRSLAAEVARVVNKNTFNMNISPGEFTSAEIDGFRPELDAYLVWLVEWVHELHLGVSVWELEGIKPHTIEVGEINVGK